MPRRVDRSRLALIALAALAANGRVATAAPFTPGNILVATAPSGAGTTPAMITLSEYTPTLTIPVQVYAIPADGSPPFGSTDAQATTAMQINFDAGDNQHVYVATTWTNISGGSRRPGFARVSAAGPAPTVDTAFENGGGDLTCRGAASGGGYVFTSTTGLSGVARNVGAASEMYLPGNVRWLDVFGGELYLSTGSIAAPFTSAPGMYKTSLSGPPPAAVSLLFTISSTNCHPLGFAVADAATIYLAVHLSGGGLTNGLYKWTNSGGVWTGQGRLAAIDAPVYDVDASVSGATATVYAVTDTSVWKLTDPLASAGGAWTGAMATAELNGLSRGRSLAIVPGTAAVACGCAGDLTADQKANGRDIAAFVTCLLGGGGSCACGDFNFSNSVTTADVGPFVSRLLTFGSCS